MILEGKSTNNSVGAIITNGEKILICHNSKKNEWDLPKGRVDKGESFEDALKREVKEELGIGLKKLGYMANIELGKFTFKNHNLYITIFIVDDLPNIDKLESKNLVKINGKIKPEMDEFKYINFKDSKKFLGKKLYKVLDKFIDMFKFLKV